MIKHLKLYPGNCEYFTAASTRVHASGDARSRYHDTKRGATCTNREFNDGKFTTTQVFPFAFHLLFSPKMQCLCPKELCFLCLSVFVILVSFLIVLTSACYFLVRF